MSQGNCNNSGLHYIMVPTHHPLCRYRQETDGCQLGITQDGLRDWEQRTCNCGCVQARGDGYKHQGQR